MKNKLRNKAAFHNSDVRELFTNVGQKHLKAIRMSNGDRAITESLLREWRTHQAELEQVDAELKAFRKEAPIPEREARAVLATIPQVADVTIDVVLSELGELASLSQRPGRGQLRRIGSRPPGECRQTEGTEHHQGGLAKCFAGP